IEAGALRRADGQTICLEPRGPTVLLVLALDQDLVGQIRRSFDVSRHLWRTQWGQQFTSEWNGYGAFRPGLTVDDVDVELVRFEPHVIGVCREPQINIGMRREEARQSRHQPLRGKAGSAMKSQDGGPTRGYRLNAIPQIFESPTDIAVEEFPFRRQVNFSCASHKQLYPHASFKFSYGMAHCAGRQRQLFRSLSKGAGAPSGFECA